MKDNSDFFVPGKMGFLLSGSAGSTGKGSLGCALVVDSSIYVDVLSNSFSCQASHTVIEDDGTKHVYKHLNSCAHLPDSYGKMFISGGAISLPVLLDEIKKYGMTPDKLGIHPLCIIIQDIDVGYEKGENGFDGEPKGAEMIRTGTTASGVGSGIARKVLRRPDALYTKDIAELAPFICIVEDEISEILDNGGTGLMEIAQGMSLGNSYHKMFPFVTSRNVTIMQGMNDLNLSPKYCGNVILDFRTLPIRIHNNRYISTEDVVVSSMIEIKAKPDATILSENGYHQDHFTVVHMGSVPETAESIQERKDARVSDHDADASMFHNVNIVRPVGANLYWREVNDPRFEGKFEVFEANSGPGYGDDVEYTWEEVRAMNGADRDLEELTTLTQLPRRVFSISRENVKDAIRYNQPPSPYKVFISMNFVNFLDWSLCGVTDKETLLKSTILEEWDQKFGISEEIAAQGAEMYCYRTGPLHSEYVKM